MDGANAFSNMAQALVMKFKSAQAATETKGIIDGLNIVMKASVDTSNEVKLAQSSNEIKDWIDDSNEARNKQDQEKVRQQHSTAHSQLAFPNCPVKSILGTKPSSFKVFKVLKGSLGI